MELGEPHLPHPQLRLAMAQAHIALGNPAAARGLLNAVLAGKPDKDQSDAATRLLQACRDDGAWPQGTLGAPPTMASAAPQPHILVVEDHAPLREQIVALLGRGRLPRR